MFTFLLKATLPETAGAVVDLRTSIDRFGENPVSGVYDPVLKGWRFDLDTTKYAAGFTFKFFIHSNRWQRDPDLEQVSPEDGRTYTFELATLDFQTPAPTEPPIDLSRAQDRLFNQKPQTGHLYDVIVIGSGMAGGTLADHASDQGLDVLVLEAGGMLFPTHIGNLPRQNPDPGAFSKHIWELWDELSVRNWDAADDGRNEYGGGQGFNLGGRSLFWGGFIPRMTSWELDAWSTRIKWYLEDSGYNVAEDFMGRSTGPRTPFNRQVHLALRALFPDMHHADAPVAIRQKLEGANTIASGVFSTADVLIESHLTNSEGGRIGLTIQMNQEVIRVVPGANEVQVVTRDRVRDVQLTYRGRTVVLAAGCFESARLAKRSELPDPLGLIGKGTSDHPIFFTHFSIPRESPFFDPFGNVKTLSQPKEGNDPAKRAPYNMLLELGADLNHGRFIDEDVWLDHLQNRKDKMLCEVVFLCNVELEESNSITFSNDAQMRPQVNIARYRRPDLLAATDDLKWRLLKVLGAQPTRGPHFDPRVDEARWRKAFSDQGDSGEGGPGGVAHEVGSLRMQVTDKDGNVRKPGLVDDEFRYLGIPSGNVYVCDLSIFPTSPAANPSLTAVALAIRLANHLRETLLPKVIPPELFPTVAQEVNRKADAFAEVNGIGVTPAARQAIIDYVPQLAERSADWAEDLLRDLAEFLEMAAGLREGLDLRNSLLRAAMTEVEPTRMPAVAQVDAQQVTDLIEQLRILIPTNPQEPDGN
jgi:GMC oxidoreductase